MVEGISKQLIIQAVAFLSLVALNQVYNKTRKQKQTENICKINMLTRKRVYLKWRGEE
jgi:hypothetical protein